jgi:hypothetical protein
LIDSAPYSGSGMAAALSGESIIHDSAISRGFSRYIWGCDRRN